MVSEIVVVPFPHPGHLFPATELCDQLAGRNQPVTVFYPSSSSPSSLTLHRLITVVELPLADSVAFPRNSLQETLLNLIATYLDGRGRTNLPICAIVDEMIGWAAEPFAERGIPTVSFFTSSAASCALGHAMDKLISSGHQLAPEEVVPVPGLPEAMVITSFSLAARLEGPGRPRGPGPQPNGKRPPRRLGTAGGADALLFNTCSDLERPFLDYVSREAGRPVWGVGPLLPARFKDGEVRSGRKSNTTEAEVIEWLDCKPPASVIYVSFGSLVNPTDAELAELAAGLEESKSPFIWVVQPSARRHDPTGQPIDGGENGAMEAYFPAELAARVEAHAREGLIIRGWAPQLSILSHPSTGGYICHCGWNSTVEALGCGVPVLTWPVRGDQHHNARLVTRLLGAGLPIKERDDAEVTRVDVVNGIERLMADDEVRKQAAAARRILEGRFPTSSAAAINSFLDLVNKKSQPI